MPIRRRALLGLTALSACALTASALTAATAAWADGAGRPVLAPLSAWAVDRAASRASLLLLAPDAPPIRGAFKRWRAEAAFDPAHPERGRLAVSLDSASLVTGDAARDQATGGPQALAAARFPHVVFTSASVAARPGGGYVANGRLEVRGEARPAQALLSYGRDASARRLEAQIALPPDAFSPPGRPRLQAATLTLRIVARGR